MGTLLARTGCSSSSRASTPSPVLALRWAPRRQTPSALRVPGNDCQRASPFSSVSILLMTNNDGHPRSGPAARAMSLLLRPYVGNGLHHQKDGIHLGYRLPGHDLPCSPPAWFWACVKPGVSTKTNWSLTPVYNAADAVPGGLGLVGYNGHLLPHQPVGQGGSFPHWGGLRW